MHIGIVHYYSRPTWSVEQLMNAASRRGHNVGYYRIQGFEAAIGVDGVQINYMGKAFSADAIVLRSLGSVPSVEQLLKRVGVMEAYRLSAGIVINKPIAMLFARDKWFSLLRLYLHGIPVPKTIITENPYTAMRTIVEFGKTVFKPVIGSLGLGSVLVDNPDTAYHISRSLYAFKQPTYIQEYIEKPNYDIRVFVVGDRVIAAMKRVIERGWKTNIAQGARGVAISEKDHPEAFELAIKAAKVLKLDYTGVDIVVDLDGRYYVIEANASPLWRGLWMATGVNAAEHIIKYLEEIYRR